MALNENESLSNDRMIISRRLSWKLSRRWSRLAVKVLSELQILGEKNKGEKKNQIRKNSIELKLRKLIGNLYEQIPVFGFE